MRRDTIGMAMTLGAALSACASATALFGPTTPAGPGFYQTTATEFRWSSTMVPAVAVDDSFTKRFGKKRALVSLQKAFDTWNLARTAGRDGINGAPLGFYDLESVAAHEFGHALGLTHPDTAPAARNYGPFAAPNAAPWLGAGGAAAPADAVMLSTIADGVTRRDLRSDDFNGVKFLYDVGNVNPAAPGEPGHGMGGMIAGAGAFTYAWLGVDNPMMGVNNAIEGTHLGANIDIFARRFSKTGVPAESNPDDVSSHGDQEVIEVFKGVNGDVLAYAVVRFSFTPGTDGPGVIGFRNPLGVLVSGVDVYFNKDRAWHVPAPGGAAALGLASLALLRRRRA